MLFVSLAGPATNFTLHARRGAVDPRDRPRDEPVDQHRRAAALRAVPVAVRGREPVPRPVQPPADPAARRLRARSSVRLPGEVAAETWYRIRPYGILVLFLLVFSTDLVSRLFNPFLVRLCSVHRVCDEPRRRHLVARFVDVAVARAARRRPTSRACDGSSRRPSSSVWERARRADRAESVATRAPLPSAGPRPTRLGRGRALHDVGKTRSGLGTVGRVGATASRGRVGRRARVGGRRLGRYVRHDEIGADDAPGGRGARAEVAAWAARAPRPRTVAGRPGSRPEICAVLAARRRRTGDSVNSGADRADRSVVQASGRQRLLRAARAGPPSTPQTAPTAPRRRRRRAAAPDASAAGGAVQLSGLRPLTLIGLASCGWLGWARRRPGGVSGPVTRHLEHVRGDRRRRERGPRPPKARRDYYNAQYAQTAPTRSSSERTRDDRGGLRASVSTSSGAARRPIVLQSLTGADDQPAAARGRGPR